MKTYLRIPTLLAAALMIFAGVGCETGMQGVDRDMPTLSLDPSQGEILVGESTTVFAQTTNLLGREVQIEWGSTLGEVTPARSGRVARFSSDVPGTAIVTAEVNVEGRILRESVNIEIQPIE